MIVWSVNNGGMSPDPDTWRQDLLDADLIDLDLLKSRGEAVDPIYFYIAPGDGVFSMESVDEGSAEVVLYEHPDLWSGAGGHVGYADSSIEWIDGSAYFEMIMRLRRDTDG